MSSRYEKAIPPKLGKWLLESFCSYDFLPTALWDLEELFKANVATKGVQKAKFIYMKEVLGIIIHLFFKGKSQYSINKIAMFRHNILIAIRNFKRYKSTFLINLFGLATGLASAILIYLWVNDEMKMGKFQEKYSDRHVQLFVSSELSDGIHTHEWAPFPLANAMEEELPEVEKGISIYDEPYYKGVVSFNGNDQRAIPLFVTDGYFDVFSCDFVAGSKVGALNNGNVVISTQLANSLFNEPEKAVGKTLNFNGEYYKGPYVVSGVFKPDNRSTVSFDILLGLGHFLSAWRPELYNWRNGGPQTHLVLQDGVDLDEFNTKIEGLLNKFTGGSQTLIAQKYSDKYLYGKFENGVPVAGRMVYVRIFSLIALFILVIACINYMNLSTAQASRRVKEIGVKKAIGANRRNLIYQYFSESIFISFISLLLALGIVVLLLPRFNEITGKSLYLSEASSVVVIALLITLFTGFISGIYPGLYLSGFKPVLAIKGKIQSRSGGLFLRKGLVIFQFATSVILIISVVVIYNQMNFIKGSNLGYDTEHVISFNNEGKLKADPATFLSEARKFSGVVSISYLWGELPGDVSSSSGFRWKGQTPEERNTKFNFIEGGYDIGKVLGVELNEGRFLSSEFTTDDRAIVINESAAGLFGFENTIGERFDGKEIVGIVKDFHFKGFQEKIGPFFFVLSDESGEYFVAKIRAENQMETIAQIEKLYTDLNPGYPFEFRFIEDKYQQLYIEEERTATLSKYFSAIAISISCLGLLALTAFSTQRRFKEIAIRKVLGSSNFGIVRLLSNHFIGLILLAVLIGLPIGYYLMQSWLDGFVYRVDLEPVLFIISGVFMMLIAWLTIMAQIAKSANINVTESLKSE